jgi:hypothetical protein
MVLSVRASGSDDDADKCSNCENLVEAEHVGGSSWAQVGNAVELM